MAVKGDDLVKYITERLVDYLDTPKEIRRQRKTAARNSEPWGLRWFGLIPLSLSLWFKRMRK